MKIALSKIIPNPFRNLALYPLDQNQIEKLKTSVDRHGFLGGVRVRRSPTRDGLYELAYGHTRIEALRLTNKYSEVDLDVVAMSDDEMIRLMVSENATQAGSRAAAVMNEVDAVVRRIAKPMLMIEHLGEISPRWPGIAECFQSDKAYDTARGTLLNGDGIGSALIRRYMGGGDEVLCPRSVMEIKDAITSVKASGTYAKILSELSAEIGHEQEAAAREAAAAEREAERASKQAKTKPQRSAATKAKAKATKTRERADTTNKASTSAKQAAASSQKYERIFDEKCAGVFPLDEHLRVFREAVTSDSGRKYIAVEQQLPLANKIMQEAAATVGKTNRGMMGAPFIKAFVSNVITQAVQKQKGINEEERERLLNDEQDRVVLAKLDGLLWNVRSVTKSAGELFSLISQFPRWASDPRMTAIVPKIDDSLRMLNSLKGELLDGTDRKGKNSRKQIAANHVASAD